jgi:hypothetical protein
VTALDGGGALLRNSGGARLLGIWAGDEAGGRETGGGALEALKTSRRC